MKNSSVLNLKKNISSRLDFLAALGLISLTTLSGLVLSSSNSLAEETSTSTSANASVTVGSACSVSSSGNDHTATISPGSYIDEIGKTTITVTCNDSGGYALYAIGFTDNKYDGEDHTKLIGENTNQKIVTGTATSGSSSNWAMKVNKVTDSTSYGSSNLTITNSFDSYHAVPDTYTKVANYTSTTDTTLGSKLTTTYASFIAGTQAADTYNGKVKYTMVHPNTNQPYDGPMACSQNNICYSPRANDVVGTMGKRSASANTAYTLLASNFSRKGYGFAGWSDVYDYETNENAHFYGPQESYTTPADMTSGKTLYAVWIKSQGNLQDANKVSSVCSNLDNAPTDGTANLRSVSALTDQRDNETYAIAKLADGNCWMIENLRLESTNSDNTTGALAQGYGTSTTYGNFSGLASAESANFTGSANSATAATNPNSLYYAGTQSGTASINISQTNYAGFRMPRYNNFNHQTTSANRPQNPTQNTASNSTTKAGIYSYGNYYTWSAAMANTSYYSTTTTDENGYTPSEAANTSLCPKGWKLPYGKDTGNGVTSGGFSNLDIALGGTGANQSTAEASNRWRSFPNNFLYSGSFYESTASDRGSRGVYWSSTANSYSSSYRLNLLSSSVNPGTSSYNKYYGYSIRCIAGS